MGSSYSLSIDADDDAGYKTIDVVGEEVIVVDGGDGEMQYIARNNSPLMKFIKMLEDTHIHRQSLMDPVDQIEDVSFADECDLGHVSDEEIPYGPSTLEDGLGENGCETEELQVVVNEDSVVQHGSDSVRSRRKMDQTKTTEVESNSDWEKGWSVIKYPEMIDFYIMYQALRTSDTFLINKLKSSEKGEISGVLKWYSDNFGDMMEYGSLLESLTDQMQELCERIENKYKITDEIVSELESVAASDSSENPGPIPGDMVNEEDSAIYQKAILMKKNILDIRNCQKRFIDTTSRSLKGTPHHTRT